MSYGPDEYDVIEAEREEEMNRAIEDHERWLLSPGADYLFENRGE
jgi:hypothetical protein